MSTETAAAAGANASAQNSIWHASDSSKKRKKRKKKKSIPPGPLGPMFIRQLPRRTLGLPLKGKLNHGRRVYYTRGCGRVASTHARTCLTSPVVWIFVFRQIFFNGLALSPSPCCASFFLFLFYLFVFFAPLFASSGKLRSGLRGRVWQ